MILALSIRSPFGCMFSPIKVCFRFLFFDFCFGFQICNFLELGWWFWIMFFGFEIWNWAVWFLQIWFLQVFPQKWVSWRENRNYKSEGGSNNRARCGVKKAGGGGGKEMAMYVGQGYASMEVWVMLSCQCSESIIALQCAWQCECRWAVVMIGVEHDGSTNCMTVRLTSRVWVDCFMDQSRAYWKH
jgi:hypothetical protein